MTGPEHYREAERLIREAHAIPDGFPGEQYAQTLAEAQAHFTAALVAATAFSSDTMPKADWDAWRATCATTDREVTP